MEEGKKGDNSKVPLYFSRRQKARENQEEKESLGEGLAKGGRTSEGVRCGPEIHLRLHNRAD